MKTMFLIAAVSLAGTGIAAAQTAIPPTDGAQASGAAGATAGAGGTNAAAGASGATAGSGTAASGGATAGAGGSDAAGSGMTSGSDGTAGAGMATDAGAGASATGDAAGSQNPMATTRSEGATPATAPADPAAAPAATPQDFVNQLASSGMFEVQSSELALERSQAPEVQDFARMMIADHGALNEELKGIAQAKNLTVPAEIAGPAAQHMQAVTGADGASFDQAYLDHQAQAHAEAIALLEPWAAQTEDADLAALAQKALQHVRTHAERLDTMRKG